jgi:hypothetical protein
MRRGRSGIGHVDGLAEAGLAGLFLPFLSSTFPISSVFSCKNPIYLSVAGRLPGRGGRDWVGGSEGAMHLG